MTVAIVNPYLPEPRMIPLVTRTLTEFLTEWDILYQKGEITDYDTYIKWKNYLSDHSLIVDFQGESTIDMNALKMSNYAYLRLWGFVGAGTPDYYVADKYAIYGVVIQYELKITPNLPEAMASIFLQPTGIPVASGNSTVITSLNGNTDVAITAYPNPDYAFVSWSGDLTSTSNPAWIHIDADKTITANFVSTLTEQQKSSIMMNTILSLMINMMIVVMMMKMMTGSMNHINQ